jgi:hypothetical protein
MNTTDRPDTLQPGNDPRSGRPLGFWLKTVDRSISRELAALFDEFNVTPREWRLLNLIAGEVRDERMAQKLARRPGRIAPLVERGWVTGTADDWELTDEGHAMLTTLDDRVRGIRERVAGTVTPDEYATTLATLEAIARELGWTEDAVPGFEGGGRGRRMRHGRPRPRGVFREHDHGHGHGHGHGHHGPCGHRAA